MKPAVKFLWEHGANSLVSLGCGDFINRIDNHLRLMMGCGWLQFYVGIDRTANIQFDLDDALSDKSLADQLLSAHCRSLQTFNNNVKVFPRTYVEELEGIHCSVVVCQRVLPFKHWEHVIESMKPKLVLQEDLHGCELQDLSGDHCTRSRAGILHYRLQPFRPWWIFPGERNLILWRSKDFLTCPEDLDSFWKRLYKRLLGDNGG